MVSFFDVFSGTVFDLIVFLINKSMRRAVLVFGLICATVLSQDYDMTPDLAGTIISSNIRILFTNSKGWLVRNKLCVNSWRKSSFPLVVI